MVAKPAETGETTPVVGLTVARKILLLVHVPRLGVEENA
jgi:hypothetical protein